MKLFRGRAASPAPEAVTPPRDDSGPVVVLVDDAHAGREVVEWAAAEAGARQSELRIVHAFRWPQAVDRFGNATVEARARVTAERLIVSAEQVARRIVPDLRITLYACPGKAASAIAAVARHDGGESLLVVGQAQRSSRTIRSLTRQLLRRTSGSVALIGLAGPETFGPSSGRVVVGVDEDGGPVTALAFAFRATRRRGTGLTIVHARTRNGGDVGEAARLLQAAYPEVKVRWRIVAGPADSAILAESVAAALTVVGSRRGGRLRGSTAYTVQRLARGPVAVVGSRSS